MIFESYETAFAVYLWGAFALAFIMGAIANKTNFCTMGAVSDWVNMGDLGRMRSWLLAIAVAMLGVVVLEFIGALSADSSFPPYRMGQLNWLGHVLGGFLFGVGMTYASGCGNKTLVRIGGGNIKSIVVLGIVGFIAYWMISPQPVFGSGQPLNPLLFGWTGNLAISMPAGQDLGALFGGADGALTARLIIGLLLGIGLLAFIFKAAEFRNSFDNILGGVVIGLVVVGAWWLTSNITIDDGMEQYTPVEFLAEWDFVGDSDVERPAGEVRFWNNQSFTFIAPMGQAVGYVGGGFDRTLVYFGVMAVMGVILGSLLWSLISKGFRIEWFSSVRDFVNHFFGAILMGFGGVLAMGCTIGQGITGISTLAIGSFITFIFIVFGSALTMKVQYYKMVYEEEATFVKALVAGLCDMKLLPDSVRSLDKV